MVKIQQGELNAAGKKMAIVASRFNDFITQKLLDGAVDCLVRHGIKENDLTIVRVPGSFEIPIIAKKLAESRNYNAVICLGAIIKGETPHNEYIAAEAAKGIAQAGLSADVPVIFGVLTTDNIEQAIERAGTKSNKGIDAAMCAMEMADLFLKLSKKG